jgi:hypothetical protein
MDELFGDGSGLQGGVAELTVKPSPPFGLYWKNIFPIFSMLREDYSASKKFHMH